MCYEKFINAEYYNDIILLRKNGRRLKFYGKYNKIELL